MLPEWWLSNSGQVAQREPEYSLHVIGCDEVEKKEERQQIEKEIKEISEEVKNNGIITMMVAGVIDNLTATEIYSL